MTADLEEMAEKADAIAAKFREPASFDLVRAALNEAGITAARRALEGAFVVLADAQSAKRDADLEEKAARAALDRALADAEWALVPPNETEQGVKMLAADKAAWKKQEAAKDPQVAKTAEALRAAEHRTGEARDALVIADKRIGALRADLDAAIATLNALAMALPARKAAQ